jgi:formate/nitrite transporter FocA (FNT family)
MSREEIFTQYQYAKYGILCSIIIATSLVITMVLQQQLDKVDDIISASSL